MSAMKFVILFSIVITKLCVNAQAQSVTIQSIWQPTDYSWVKQASLKENAKLVLMQAQIDYSIQQRVGVNAIRRPFESALTKADTPAQRFGWAYATYATTVRGLWRNQRNREPFRKAAELLAREPVINSYEYNRLRFLIESKRFRDVRISPLGKRLLELRPDDAPVKYEVALLLSFSWDTADSQTAIRYAQEILRQSPQMPKAQTIIGSAYWSLWGGQHRAEDGRRAIAAYEEYLRLALPEDEWRSEAKRIIGLISHDMKKHGFESG